MYIPATIPGTYFLETFKTRDMESLRNTLRLLDDIQGMDDIDEIMNEVSNIRDSLDVICDSLESIVNDAESAVRDINKSVHIELDELEEDLKSASASLY